MILFGQNPSQGTLLKASQFLAEELPIRLSHRVKELDELPDRLNEMESIKRVKEWYAESFQVRFFVNGSVLGGSTKLRADSG
jgi:pyruvate dehydrogenase kinase 2/3/4